MAEQRRTRVTSHDIAREAGVTQPTVSRALRGDPRVARATVERVQTAARRLGYVPQAAARSLITRRAGTVALVASDLNNPFYPELVEALKVELEAKGFRAVLFGAPGDGAEDEGVGTLIRSGLVDGAILATARDDDATRVLLGADRGPLVLVVREVAGFELDAVVAENESGAAAAAGLLAELGHRRIGIVSGPRDTSTALERDRGFLAELKRRGIAVDRSLRRRGEFSHEVGRELCGRLLDLPEPPTAVFCANDVIALGAMDAARAREIAVPGRLSIVGFDDIAPAAWESFRLTTVHQPLREMAAAAVGMLVDRVEGEDGPPRRRTFPTFVVERATAGPPM